MSYEVELHACSACGAVVIDSARHSEWHDAVRAGHGLPMQYDSTYEFVGFLEQPEHFEEHGE